MPEGEVRQPFEQPADRVEDQEDEHLQWAEETRCRMVTILASSRTIATVTARAEELVARISSLFDEGSTA